MISEDDEGEFQLQGLRNGAEAVRVQRPSIASITQGVEQRYMDERYNFDYSFGRRNAFRLDCLPVASPSWSVRRLICNSRHEVNIITKSRLWMIPCLPRPSLTVFSVSVTCEDTSSQGPDSTYCRFLLPLLSYSALVCTSSRTRLIKCQIQLASFGQKECLGIIAWIRIPSSSNEASVLLGHSRLIGRHWMNEGKDLVAVNAS